MASAIRPSGTNCELCLGQNVAVLQSIALTTAGSKVNAAIKKSNMNNILMQLRKWVAWFVLRDWVSDKALCRCLQHPYLVSRDIEPSGLPPQETHEKLIGASSKLIMLQSMLPKLKERGHRVLLFSQASVSLIDQFPNSQWFAFSLLLHLISSKTSSTERESNISA